MNKLVRILCIVAAGIGVIYLFIDSGNKALNTLVGWIFLPLVFLFGFFCLINYWREDDESEDTEYNEQMKRFRGE